MVTPAQAREFASVLFHQRIGDDVVECINDLASQVESLQADAERYKYARKYPQIVLKNWDEFYGLPEEIDAAIDEARKQS